MSVAAGSSGEFGRSLLRGSLWMVGLRWGMRCLGLVNTFILARLLTPGDFGLVAMAMLVIGLVEVFGQTGQLLALIRIPNPTREHYDSVWTLSIMIAAVLTVVIWLLAPLTPLYFHESRAVGLTQILALRTLISGFTNVGVVAFRKDLAFAKEFRFQILQRVLTVLATVVCAVWLRDYRALAGGILLGCVLSVVLSYVLHPYRPRLCTRRIREMLSFSGWMLLVNVSQYFHDKSDEIVVGSFGSPAAMGAYNVAADAATAPTVEVVMPVARALFPVFARIGDDTAALRKAYLDLFSTVCMICISVGTGIMLVAEDFVRLALGPQWAAAVPLVRLLAISGAAYSVMHNSLTVLGAVGHARLSATLTTTRTVIAVLALIAAGLTGSVWTIALTRMIVTIAFIPGVIMTVSRVLPVTPADMAARLWRPLAAAAVMSGVVLLVHDAAPPIPALRLMLDAASGAVTYAAVVLGLWLVSGRPEGLEAMLMDRLRPAIGRLAGSRAAPAVPDRAAAPADR